MLLGLAWPGPGHGLSMAWQSHGEVALEAKPVARPWGPQGSSSQWPWGPWGSRLCATGFAPGATSPSLRHRILPIWSLGERCLKHVRPGRCLKHVRPGPYLKHVRPGRCLKHVRPGRCLKHVRPGRCLKHVSPGRCLKHSKINCNLQFPWIWKFLLRDMPVVVAKTIRKHQIPIRILNDQVNPGSPSILPAGFPGSGQGSEGGGEKGREKSLCARNWLIEPCSASLRRSKLLLEHDSSRRAARSCCLSLPRARFNFALSMDMLRSRILWIILIRKFI